MTTWKFEDTVKGRRWLPPEGGPSLSMTDALLRVGRERDEARAEIESLRGAPVVAGELTYPEDTEFEKEKWANDEPTAQLCVGDVCAGCGRCRDCDRIVRPDNIHLNHCACPPDTNHPICPSCSARRTAFALTTPGEKWWKDDPLESAPVEGESVK